jgi:putative peptide zinc metalloprotease protein
MSDIAQSVTDGGRPWSVDDVSNWAMMLVKSGLAIAVDRQGNRIVPPDSPPTTGKPPLPPGMAIQKAAKPLAHLVSQRFPLGSADRLATWLCPLIGGLFSPPGLAIWTLTAAMAISFASSHSGPLGAELRMMFSPAAWPLLGSIWIVLKVIHEAGHAVAAKRKGVRVGKCGLTLFLFAPVPYVDVTDAWKLVRPWSRVQIAMAGVYLEGWAAILATFAYVVLPDGLPRHLAAQVMMMAGPATWLVNANPLMRLDGYYALADATNIPNLRMHGRRFWSSIFERIVLGIPIKPAQLHGWRHPAAAIHSAASLVFQACWTGGLMIAISKWGGPVGFLMTCTVVTLWCAVPVAVWAHRHWLPAGEEDCGVASRRKRLVVFGAVSVVSIAALMNVPSPLPRSIPVMVRYRDEQVARAASAGLVAEVAVKSGQRVRKGDSLVVVRDEDLMLKRDQMYGELQVASSKQRQLSRRGELGSAEAQNETVRTLHESLRELDQKVAALEVRATAAGVVITPNPENLVGRYVRPGEVLLRVANSDRKELLVAFPESDWAAYERVVRDGKPLVARLRGGYRMRVEPQPAKPRFSDSLPHPSFGGGGGGDIAVIPDKESEGGVKASIPLGEAIATVSRADRDRIHSGQRGRLYLRDPRSIAERLWMFLSPE